MEKISIYNANGFKSEVYLVRYFKLDYTNYLVYTVFERDEKGFIKLYLIKIMDELGKKVGISILEDEEWKNMQKVIKTVIKEIKDNKIDSFEDLLTNGLEKVKVGEAKFFKLDQNLTDLLSAKVEEKVLTENKTLETDEHIVNSDDVVAFDYSIVCKDIKKKIKKLDKLINEKIIDLNNYKTKYGNLDSFKFVNKKNINFELISDESTFENYKVLQDVMQELEENLVDILIDLSNYTLQSIEKGQ